MKPERGRPGISLARSMPAAAARSCISARQSTDHIADVEALALDLELSGLDLRHVEDVVDQFQQMGAGIVDHAGVVAIARIAQPAEHLRSA